MIIPGGPKDRVTSEMRCNVVRASCSFAFHLLIADCNLPIRSGAQLSSSADGTLRHFLNCRLVSRSDCDILSLLTLA